MTMQSSFGNVTVPYPQDDDPRHGGGPIRRAYEYMVQSDYGMEQYPSLVMRSPHGVSPDENSGETWPPVLMTQKMLPDGRLVDMQTGLRGPDVDLLGLSTEASVGLGFLLGSLATGGLLGLVLASPGRRLIGTGKGMLMGGATVGWLALGAQVAKGASPTVSTVMGVASGVGIGATAGAIYGTPGARGKAMSKGALAGAAGAAGISLTGLAMLGAVAR